MLRIAIAITTILIAPLTTFANCPQVGDVTCDCNVDENDLALFITTLIDDTPLPPCALTQADTNNDGSIDGLDIAGFIAAFVELPPVIVVSDWGELWSAAATYQACDTIRLNAASFDGSAAAGLLIFDNGDVTFDWNTDNQALAEHITGGGTIDIDVGSYGALFWAGAHDTAVTSDAPIRWIRTGMTADTHIVHFRAVTNILTANVANWAAVGNNFAVSSIRSAFRFDATTGNLTATMTDCVASNMTNDGFSTNVADPLGTSNLTLIDCIAFGNDDEAVSPHNHARLTIIGGIYESSAPLGNVMGTGNSTAPDMPIVVDIQGGTFTGNGSQGCINAGNHAQVTITNADITQRIVGRLFVNKTGSIIDIANSTITAEGAMRAWDTLSNGGTFTCADSTWVYTP